MRWLQPTIGDVCEPTSQTNPATSGRESFRYIDISGIDRDAKVIARADTIPCAEAPSRARKQVQAGDVLVSTVRPNLNAIAVVPQELDGEIASTGFAVLRARRKVADPRYLLYRAQHSEFVDFLVANATGASYPAVSDAIVKRAPLPLPSPSEQRRIVEILDQADALRKRAREADAKAARILPALFVKMFGDPATNPMGWPVKSLGDRDVCEINPRTEHDLADDMQVSFVPMADVDERLGRIMGTQTRTVVEVKKGFTPFVNRDVLFAKITPCMQNGKSAIADNLVNGRGYGSTEFHVLRAADGIAPEWLFTLVRLPAFRAQAVAAFTGSAGQQRVPANFLKQYRLPVPDKAAMSRFATAAAEVSRLALAGEIVASKMNTMVSVLLQRAFSGQLTAKWREAHMQELLAEMQEQAHLLNLPMPA
jgi:type I restriction enzyme S subunit